MLNWNSKQVAKDAYTSAYNYVILKQNHREVIRPEALLLLLTEFGAKRGRLLGIIAIPEKAVDMSLKISDRYPARDSWFNELGLNEPYAGLNLEETKDENIQKGLRVALFLTLKVLQEMILGSGDKAVNDYNEALIPHLGKVAIREAAKNYELEPNLAVRASCLQWEMEKMNISITTDILEKAFDLILSM